MFLSAHSYAGRPVAAAPATGSKHQNYAEVEAYYCSLFGPEPPKKEDPPDSCKPSSPSETKPPESDKSSKKDIKMKPNVFPTNHIKTDSKLILTNYTKPDVFKTKLLQSTVKSSETNAGKIKKPDVFESVEPKIPSESNAAKNEKPHNFEPVVIAPKIPSESLLIENIKSDIFESRLLQPKKISEPKKILVVKNKVPNVLDTIRIKPKK